MSIAPSILLVDDDPDLLEMVCMTLKAQQLQVTSIGEGKRVQAYLETTSPDLIVMDIYLGDSDGREISKIIKNDSHSQHIPVILYSAGHISSKSIEESKADRFVAKPFDLLFLIKMIKSLLPDNSQT